ncbi:SpaA isopeptide-forming pilin-related protein [Sporolactobacillus sp. CPB3-1]|uniref:SpaA isopeptide-forming pilin-related protein n=1 Tax=Sporolactobacillus mangiferae TaxID=2940498 RepID=A0ABT0M923_9BACL|nr:SpaA isopeptide-forming pilin-related protein [Sporolactobacillus mangiferae]MCL1631380.1 SpaA isopeptide-forming pilin-related protein [Sporolactobacillus mangiferae]
MFKKPKKIFRVLRYLLTMLLLGALMASGALHPKDVHAAESSPSIDVNHPLGVAENFNAFILNDMRMASDAQGRLAVGHDVTLSNYMVATNEANNDAINFVIGHSLTYNGGELHGRYVIGENGSAAINGANARKAEGVSIAEVPDFSENHLTDFSGAKNQLINYSHWYTKLSGVRFDTGEVTRDANSVTFSYSGSDPGVVVFQLDAADFNQFKKNEFQINYNIPRSNASTTIIVNVAGSSAINMPGWSTMYNGNALNEGDARASRILYNMPDVRTINQGNGALFGSILAPNATFNAGGGNLNGTLIANNFFGIGGGHTEIHKFLFHPVFPSSPAPIKGKITLKKVDAEHPGTTLSGAEFALQQKEGSSWSTIDKLITKADGTVTKEGLPLGVYRLVETKAPAGYEKGSVPPTFDLSKEDPNKTITVENRKKPVNGSITLKKVDAEHPGTTLSGAEFALQQKEGSSWSTIDKLITKADGTVTKEGLPLGAYRLVETKAPAGYALSSEARQVTLTRNHLKSLLIFKNVKQPAAVTGSVTLKKVDAADSNHVLEGARFVLQKLNAKSEWTTLYTLTTDKKGIITKSGLELGTYRWAEQSAPAGYSLSTDARPFTLTRNHPIFMVTIKNTKIPETVTSAHAQRTAQPQPPDIEHGVMGEEQQTQNQSNASESTGQAPASKTRAVQRGYSSQIQPDEQTSHALPVTGDSGNSLAYLLGTVLLVAAAGIIGFAQKPKN